MAPRSRGVDPVAMVGRERERATVDRWLAATAEVGGRVLLMAERAGR